MSKTVIITVPELDIVKKSISDHVGLSSVFVNVPMHMLVELLFYIPKANQYLSVYETETVFYSQVGDYLNIDKVDLESLKAIDILISDLHGLISSTLAKVVGDNWVNYYADKYIDANNVIIFRED